MGEPRLGLDLCAQPSADRLCCLSTVRVLLGCPVLGSPWSRVKCHPSSCLVTLCPQGLAASSWILLHSAPGTHTVSRLCSLHGANILDLCSVNHFYRTRRAFAKCRLLTKTKCCCFQLLLFLLLASPAKLRL